MSLDILDGRITWGLAAPPEPPFTPVVISNVAATVDGTTSAHVAWDVAPGAQGQVEYGLSTSYGFTTALETNYLTHHNQPVTGLDAGTTYHYRVKVIDLDGVVAYSTDGTFTTTAGIPPSPPAGASSVVYGTCNTNGVGNLHVWTSGDTTRAAFRFRAPRTGYLRGIRWYAPTGSGYASGDPLVQISLRKDVPGGSPSHTPDLSAGGLLSQCPIYHGNISDAGVHNDFSTAYLLQAGTLYHIDFFNASGDTSANTFSPNCIVDQSGEPDMRWGPGSLDMGAQFFNNNAWEQEAGISHRQGYAPIMDLEISATPAGPITDHFGQAHLYLGTDLLTIGGNSQARERIVVSGGDRVVTGVEIYLERVSGSGSLTAYLEDGSGNIIDQAAFPYTDFVTGDGTRNNAACPNHAVRDFAASRTLPNGGTRYLRLAAPSGTTYMMEPFEKGDNYGYHPSLSFPDGYLQRSSAGAAGPWSSDTIYDMQFLFQVAP